MPLSSDSWGSGARARHIGDTHARTAPLGPVLLRSRLSPRHPKDLSTCCRGEEPHTVGWRFIGERRAINLDPNCGWARGKADVLYLADAFEVMSRVNQLLGAS